MKVLTRAAVVAGAAAMPLAMALPAFGTVNPTTLGVPSAAGAYAAPTADHLADGDHITGVKAQFFLRQQAEFDMACGTGLCNTPNPFPGAPVSEFPPVVNQSKGPMMGVELCQATSFSTSTFAAVLFAQWNSTSHLFDIYTGSGPTGPGGCLAAKGAVAVHEIDTVPGGHTVFLAITQGFLGSIHVTDEDLTADLGATDQFPAPGFFYNRAGIGSEQGIPDLNSPPAVRLVRFTNDKVRETSFGPLVHHWINIGNPTSTRIRTRKVEQANPASDVFVSPDLNGTRLILNRGTLNS